LFDLKRDGLIDRNRCKEALKTMANNEFEFEQVDVAEIPEKVDEKTFVGLCEKVLGYKQK
jgi:Ca2+-binding EF-hand superfamily protein